MCVSLFSAFGTGAQAGVNLQTFAGVMSGVSNILSGVSRSNIQAGFSEADALSEERLGQDKARVIRKVAARETGTSRAQAAAAGVTLDSGSVLEAERQIVRGSEEDALSAILTGQNRAASLRLSGDMYRADAKSSLWQGVGQAAFAVSGWRRVAAPDPLNNFFRYGSSGD